MSATFDALTIDKSNQFVTRSAEQRTSIGCVQTGMVLCSLSRIAAVCFTGWV